MQHILIFTAILGWLYIEWRSIASGIRDSRSTPNKFDLGYYWNNNYPAIILNAIGTIMVFFMSNAIMIAERYLVQKYITDDPAFIEGLTDYVLLPVTGAAIGLFGATFVRWSVDKSERKAAAKRAAEMDAKPPVDGN
jgi:hypothetical protein